MRNDSKLQQIRDAMQADDWDEALKIANRFTRLGEFKEAIQLAAESASNPEFYKGLGYDLHQLKEAGIAAIKTRFNKSWEESQKKKDGA